MRAIQITEFGGPEVLTPTDLPEPEPSDGFSLVDVTGAGVNYADTHQWRYSMRTSPGKSLRLFVPVR